MTVKLYEKNALLTECQAQVVGCEPEKDYFRVALDQTVIFPEGGGQLSDQGKIQDAEVFHAAEKEGQVWHYTKTPLAVGEKVHVSLNWPLRLDRMQQHTGEHLLSYAFWQSCGAQNIGFHMNEDLVTIDLDQEVTSEEIARAEMDANAVIWENRPITVAYLPDAEVAKLPMRKKNEKLQGILRVVTVENGDICTCCGTHPPFTGMVGQIKILRAEKHKGGTRIFFNCGCRALKNMQQRNEVLVETSNLLSVKEEEVLGAVQKLKAEVAELTALNKEKTMALLKSQVPELLAQAVPTKDGYKLVFVVTSLEAKEAKSLRQLLGEEEGVIIALVSFAKGRVSYQFALGRNTVGDCHSYCQKANAIFHGKGGGRDSFAQGGAEIEGDWQKLAQQLKEEIQ